LDISWRLQGTPAFNPFFEPIKSLIRLWWRIMLWGLRIAPGCFVIVVPAVALYDQFSPWPPAMEALSAYPKQMRFCVGLSTESRRAPTDYHSRIQRSFVLLPRAFTLPSLVTITSADSARPIVEESRLGFWVGASGYISMLIICGWQIRRFLSARRSTTGNVQPVYSSERADSI
jgi:hypothetical protein